jgi:Tfp pilus assembly protein PilF
MHKSHKSKDQRENAAESLCVFCASFWLDTVAALHTKQFRLASLLIAGYLVMHMGMPTCEAQSSTPAGSRFIAEGIAALDRGDASVARDLFERAVKLEPRSVEAHTMLGVLFDRQGDLSNAERHFFMAASLAPQSSQARNNYGAVLLKLNRTKEAAAEFEASLRLNPKQPNALVNLAQISFESDTPESLRLADELFMRADALAPDTEIARALTVIALRRSDREAAARHYRSYASRLTADGAASPAHNAAARSDLGAALYEAGLLDEAEVELQAALQLEPSNVAAITRLARVYLARKDIPAAGRTLEGAVARKVEAAPVYALLALVYERSGHIENAIPAMRLAIQLDPQAERYRFQYGVLLTNADAPAAAIIRIKESLQSFPGSANLWVALGLANLKLGNNNDAVQAFNRAIELDPKSAQAYAYLGISSVDKGQYKEAVGFYEHALRIDPSLAIIHYLIGDTLLKEPDVDPAAVESHFKQAVQLDASYAPARVALGKLYARAGRLNEAVPELERAIALDPGLAEAYYHLGRVYSRLKRTADAEATLATYTRLSDGQKEREARERIDIFRRLTAVLF